MNTDNKVQTEVENTSAEEPTAESSADTLETRMARKGFVPVSDAATLAGRHFTRIYAWIKQGKVKASEAAGKTFVDLASLKAFLEPRRIEPAKGA